MIELLTRSLDDWGELFFALFIVTNWQSSICILDHSAFFQCPLNVSRCYGCLFADLFDGEFFGSNFIQTFGNFLSPEWQICFSPHLWKRLFRTSFFLINQAEFIAEIDQKLSPSFFHVKRKHKNARKVENRIFALNYCDKYLWKIANEVKLSFWIVTKNVKQEGTSTDSQTFMIQKHFSQQSKIFTIFFLLEAIHLENWDLFCFISINLVSRRMKQKTFLVMSLQLSSIGEETETKLTDI